jgi:hypothetical protein
MNVMVTCRKCGNDFRSAAGRCPICYTLLVASAPLSRTGRRPATKVLQLVIRIAPTGGDLSQARPIPLEEGVQLMVGREADGEVGDLMDEAEDAYEDVSREHVYLTADGRDVLVRDVSRRGTYVNDRRLITDEQVRFSAPVTLRLASGCFIRVELERLL